MRLHRLDAPDTGYSGDVTITIPGFGSKLNEELWKMKTVHEGWYKVKLNYAIPEEALQNLLYKVMIENGLRVDGTVHTEVQSAHYVSVHCELLNQKGVRYSFYASVNNYTDSILPWRAHYSKYWKAEGSLSFVIGQESFNQRTGKPQ